jgi:hypothetical protein
LHPVKPWQVQIEDYYVVVDFHRSIPGFLSVGKNIDYVLLAFQTLTDESGERLIVLCHKNSHNSEPSLIELLSLVRKPSIAALLALKRRYVVAKMDWGFESEQVANGAPHLAKPNLHGQSLEK